MKIYSERAPPLADPNSSSSSSYAVTLAKSSSLRRRRHQSCSSDGDDSETCNNNTPVKKGNYTVELEETTFAKVPIRSGSRNVQAKGTETNMCSAALVVRSFCLSKKLTSYNRPARRGLTSSV